MNLRRLRQISWSIYNLPVVAAATLWRRYLRKTTCIAITGSMGKSTATKCLFRILSARFPCVTNEASNGRKGLPRTLLRLRPRHKYGILEVGIIKKNRMWRSAWMVQPQVAVMTGVARRHMSALGTLDDVLHEKAQLMRYLTPDGLAVLNGDDERVAGLAPTLPCPVKFFGMSPDYDVWADEVSAVWPERLRMRVHVGDESYVLQTALVGAHWTPAVLAAIATAVGLGVPPREAVEALDGIEPFQARLDPVPLPNGAVILRDEYNGGLPTYEVALGILREARVERRIALVGYVTEAEGGPAEGARRMGALLAESADIAVLFGDRNQDAREAAVEAGMPSEKIFLVDDVWAMSDWVAEHVRGGDLVLLKGEWFDHLSRAVFAQLGTVDCWRADCGVPFLCDLCSRLGFVPHPELAGTPRIGRLWDTTRLR